MFWRRRWRQKHREVKLVSQGHTASKEKSYGVTAWYPVKVWPQIRRTGEKEKWNHLCTAKSIQHRARQTLGTRQIMAFTPHHNNLHAQICPQISIWWFSTIWRDFSSQTLRPKSLHGSIKPQVVQCQGFPGSLVGKESACSAGDLGLIPGLGRSLEKGMANHSSILAWKLLWTEECSGKEPAWRCRRHKRLEFDPGVRKIF